MSYALWFSNYVKEQYCITTRRQKNRQNGCMSKEFELAGQVLPFCTPDKPLDLSQVEHIVHRGYNNQGKESGKC